MKVAIIWASFGPYHQARLKAVSELLGEKNAFGIEISNCNETYDWKVNVNGPARIFSVFKNLPAERVPVFRLFFRLMKLLAREKPDVCFVPSYWPASSAAVLFAAKWSGCKCVMMNDSHRGTARSKGLKHWVKKGLVKMFDAALVGGAPQQEYFSGLGFSDKNLFAGYDTVDNDYFREKAETLRTETLKAEVRSRYGLPERYFLSLGRFVAKKNLSALVRAYRLLLKKMDGKLQEIPHLVVVGSGEEEVRLRALCDELQLPVYDKTKAGSEKWETENGDEPPGVHFYGFRQIEENPIFYALADVFILPSLWEEWGLVVNEAMASGLPVIVSKAAGCAPDLVQEGVNGFTFDPEDVEQLAELMAKISAFNFPLSVFGAESTRIISHWGCDNFARNALRAAEAALGNER